MTEEEAIIEMQRMKKAYCNTHTDAQLKKDSKIIDALDMGIKAIKALEQQPKIGHWVVSVAIQGEIAGQIVKAFNCSECGSISVFRMIDGKIVNGNLCPNCGAKMQEVGE